MSGLELCIFPRIEQNILQLNAQESYRAHLPKQLVTASMADSTVIRIVFMFIC
jgi:hypothetical protein